MSAWRDATPRVGGRWAPSRKMLAAGLLAALVAAALGAIAAVGSSGGRKPAPASAQTRAHPNAGKTIPAGGHAEHAGRAVRASGHTDRAGRAVPAGGHTDRAGQAVPAGGHTDRAGQAVRASGHANHTDRAAPAATGSDRLVAEVRDPEEANSYPAPPSVHHSAAKSPQAAGAVQVAAGAASDAEIRSELAKMRQVESAADQPAKMATVPGGNSIVGNDGAIPIPRDVPEVVQRVIAGANAIANFPYVYGGGHASFVDSAYDCSGSVSYALAAGGLLGAPETSGQLESWGAPGPGRWITVYANAGHTYMYVNIGGAWMLYDTAGRSGVFASRWQPYPVDNAGYVVRHPAGL